MVVEDSPSPVSLRDLEVGTEPLSASATVVYKNKRKFPSLSTVLMWTMLFVTISVAIFLTMDIFFGLQSKNYNMGDGTSTPSGASSKDSLPSHIDGLTDIMVAGQNFVVIDKTIAKEEFDESTIQKIPLPTKIRGKLSCLVEKLERVLDRREIQMSSTVSMLITIVSVLVIIGCTALAVQTGITEKPILDVSSLHMTKRICFYLTYSLGTVTVILMVFALFLVPNHYFIQILATAFALLSIMAITGGMISDLLYRAQATVFSEAMTSDASRFGLWLTQFGLGGVTSFSMGVFGCSLVVFGVEMLLFRVKNTWQEPIVMGIALPIAIIHNLGTKHLSFFQKLLKLALLIRLVLWVLAWSMPHFAMI